MCVPLAVAAGAAMAAGQLFQGYTAMQQGQYEADMAKRNAALEVEAAQDSIERGKLEARDLHRTVAETKGQQAASMAANGIDLGFGSGLRAQQDTAMLAQEDAENLYSNINERTRGRLINAQNFKAEARAARHKGNTAMVGSVFQAGASLMGGFQQQAQMKAKLGITGGG